MKIFPSLSFLLVIPLLAAAQPANGQEPLRRIYPNVGDPSAFVSSPRTIGEPIGRGNPERDSVCECLKEATEGEPGAQLSARTAVSFPVGLTMADGPATFLSAVFAGATVRLTTGLGEFKLSPSGSYSTFELFTEGEDGTELRQDFEGYRLRSKAVLTTSVGALVVDLKRTVARGGMDSNEFIIGTAYTAGRVQTTLNQGWAWDETGVGTGEYERTPVTKAGIAWEATPVFELELETEWGEDGRDAEYAVTGVHSITLLDFHGAVKFTAKTSNKLEFTYTAILP